METLLEIRINAFPNELEVEIEWSERSTGQDNRNGVFKTVK